MSGVNLGWLGAATIAFLTAASLLRAYVDHAAIWMIAVALVLYSLGNLMMVPLMRGEGMAVAMSVAAVTQLVMANAVAVALFGERPNMQQWAGIALGLVAVALIVTAKGDSA
ncbi:MAG: hypothetical protein ACRBB0_11880 [Pelagimonas sp.]|uniref:hypothetical protein n=1 Tax=Pelagimonas sp. TaxID=2073170 RepID=UPI003D6C5137